MSDKKEEEKNKNGEGEENNSQETASGQESSDSQQSGAKSSSLLDMDFLRGYLSRSLGIQENPPCKLESLTLEGISKYLASDACKNVITMAGAGISTSAGIPDFRSPGTGLYDNLASYNLPHPQAIFELEFFKENPRPFFVLAKELYPGSFKPTVCHYFIKMLHDKGKLLRHYTQNIDTLERVAGLPAEKLIEAHGTFHTSHCLQCNMEYQQEWMKEQIFADKVPRCAKEDCDGVIKPDIVFFGESLPANFAKAVGEDFRKCDLLIVMGTSLMVQPFASLTNRVPAEAPRLYINLEKGQSSNNPMTVLFFGGGGFNFDGEDNYRDVFKGATCDDGCQELADLLGWGDELKTIVQEKHAQIDRDSLTSVQPAGAAKSAKPSASSAAAKSKDSSQFKSAATSKSKTTATAAKSSATKSKTPSPSTKKTE